ncbi:MAG: DNA-directed RNA polymerase subunit beta, partial [Candidatus Buchananbacteria bacterium]
MSSKKQTRKSFTPRKLVFPIPDLIEVQKNSYQWFMEQGLGELFEEVSPIRDFIGRDFELYFGKYYLDEPKFDEVTSKQKNLSYEAPLRVVAKLVNRKLDKKIEQEVYLGDFPLMTDRGTFIINGIERAIVSQLIRSAGIFFTSEVYGERRYYGAKIIPNRGSWLELETDINNVIWVKIDRKRKISVTSLFRIFGYPTDEEISNIFKDIDVHPEISYIKNTLAKDTSQNESDAFIEVYKRIRPGDLATVDNAKSLIYAMFFNFERYDFGKVGRYKINQRFNQDLPITKENRVFRVQDLIAVVSEIIKLNISQKDQDDIDHLGNRRVRAIGELVQNKFRVGLARMERIIKDRMSTLEISEITPNRLINARPVIGSVKEFFMSSQLSQFMDQTNPLSELEHKRRLSAMGPGGLSRERAGFDVRDVHPTHYGRICPIATPEGPNIGLVGHLASFARVNDYGFIETPCRVVKHNLANKASDIVDEIAFEDIIDPSTKKVVIKKDEKISEKAAKDLEKITEIKRVLVKPRVTNEVVYLTAFQSENSVSTAATTPIDENGYFLVERTEVRKYGEPGIEHVVDINYMDVAPNQIVSVATSLIPFLEHDDAVRALMGSNMQRQSVPCIKPQSPIVGTGWEAVAARDSGHVITSKVNGTIASVQADKIVLKSDAGDLINYRLNKFVRSNASTCINQRPIVEKGQVIAKGDVLADGPSTQNGELGLGQNITVAFMAWEGYNYEDAIVVSEKMVREDRFTSIYIEDF